MSDSAQNPRFVLGLKLRSLRQERGVALKDLAARSGLSISYLSEIEKGKKYPKPEKLLALAGALGVPYDELVSLRLAEGLDPLQAMLGSPLLKEFPFELFGLEPEDLLALVSDEPEKAGALVRALADVGQTYDLQVEHFLFAALRSYQQMNANYFPDLEEEAARFRAGRGWPEGRPPAPVELRRFLEEEHGYRIDETTLPAHDLLRGLRSVFLEGARPTLLLNGRLLPSQKAFILGREIGYRHLRLVERAATSSWLKVESFRQLLNNFKASYFSGALLLDRHRLERDLAAFFARPKWDGARFLALMRRYQATPEMFFYRLTELAPARFGLRELFFLRFSNAAGGGAYHLTKVLNMSPVPVPHWVGLDEHYCRRWPPLGLLRELAARQAKGDGEDLAVAAHRCRFLDEGAEFFVLSVARPLALSQGTNSSVSVGFLVNEAFAERVRFGDDPAIPRLDVGLTCERCRLAPEECAERSAPPTVHARQREQAAKEEALAVLLRELAAANGGRDS